jgi:hypothetical protein
MRARRRQVDAVRNHGDDFRGFLAASKSQPAIKTPGDVGMASEAGRVARSYA